MFTRITNLDRILSKTMCCECEQEISPTVDSQLGACIPILRIRICMGGPICATDLRCTLVRLQVTVNIVIIIVHDSKQVKTNSIVQWDSSIGGSA